MVQLWAWVNEELWFHTCEVFWVGHRVRQLLLALNLCWHGCHHHAIRELLLDASGKVLLPGVTRNKNMGGAFRARSTQSTNIGKRRQTRSKEMSRMDKKKQAGQRWWRWKGVAGGERGHDWQLMLQFFSTGLLYWKYKGSKHLLHQECL